MGKLIFFDIDGTIAIPGQSPGRDTVAAIRAARANGHKVFLSTGRMESVIPEHIRSIGFDGGIYSAGGRVVVDGKELLNRSMSTDLVRQVTDTMREYQLFYMLENASGTYVGAEGRSLPGVSGDLRRLMEQELHILPYKQMPEHDLTYKIVFHAESIAQAEQLVKILSTTAKVVYFSGLLPDMPVIPGEVSDPDVNKGDALIRICQYLTADPKDCVAFGDSMNDAEILRAAGTGIAMGNAEDHVKEIADQVCERCDEDGIAKALTRLGLIQEAQL